MKTIIRITLLLVTMLTAMGASAMTASEALSKTSKKINAAKSITATFGGSASGTLTVSGKMFSMVTPGIAVWYNGTDMWTYSQRAGETSLTRPTQDELMESNPMEVVKNYGQRYTVTKVSESQGKFTVKLTPKSKNDNIKSATIEINTRTWMPQSIDIVLSNDSRMTINIKSITEGAAMKPSQFVYPKANYPGIEVVDLR